MNQTAAELKAVAKAVGASLSRSGNPVPHTALLNALAGALNKRNWNTLAGTLPAAAVPASPRTAATAPVEPEYTPGTWFLLQLTYALGFGAPPKGLHREPDVRAWALNKTTGVVSGVLKWGGWSLPSDLDLKSCTLDAEDFVPEHGGVSQGAFLVQTPGAEPFSFSVSHSRATGWVLTTADTTKAMRDMDVRVPRATLMAQGLGQAAYAVPAFVETDDHAIRVEFDAAGFLLKASASQVCAVLEALGTSSGATDAVAQWEQSYGTASKDIARIQAYLEALQLAPDCETGFHCSVDVAAMLTWLETFRPATLALALCAHQGVTLVECEEPELAGRWDWLSSFENCDASQDSEEDAALDAMRRLNLLAAVRSTLG